MKKLVYLLSPFLLIACEMVLDIDIPEFDPSLVVNGVFTPDSTFSLILSRDFYILDNRSDDLQNAGVDGATIRLYEDEKEIGTFSKDSIRQAHGAGFYVLDYHPVQGKAYRLEINKAGFNSVMAMDRIPVRTPDISILSVDTIQSEYEAEIDIRLQIHDSPGKDFYELQMYQLDFGLTFLGDSVTDISEYFTPAYFESDNIIFESYMWERKVFGDALFDGGHYEILLKLRGVTSYIDYLNEMYGLELRGRLVLEVKSISEAYYTYFQTAALQRSVRGDPFAQPVQVYSNVENGYGIFAGYSPYRLEIRP
ncbi:MAG: DUF4249 domain-containing protein [Cyclobacteriaceae bacterium]|nr:DUF4249 domain-containing protein [Cyclobacteriaceae bacterium]